MKLDKYVCKDTVVNGVKFTAKIVNPKGKNNVRSLEKLRGINYITVHNTGNSSATAGDENHAVYLQNVEDADSAYVSWHITVDADSATQHLPFDEVGFHAGDGKGNGNRESIGIEIAENKNYPKCEANGIKIICALMKQFNIPIERVKPHRYFATNKKLCPWRILKSQATWEKDWAGFQYKIMFVYNSIYGNSNQIDPPATVTQPTNNSFRVGQSVKVKATATKYATGQNIASFVKGNSYSIARLEADRALLSGINSWVYLKDLEGSPDISVPKAGVKVKIVGNKYATGQPIPQWVKNSTHIVSKIENDKVLVGANGGINSWINKKDLQVIN